MNYLAIKYKLRTVECWVLLSLLTIGIYFLIQALGMPFGMRRTIGPGFFPTIVLSALVLYVVLALTNFIRNDAENVYANFPEGTEDDTTLKALIKAMSNQGGASFAITTCAGLGRFSAATIAARGNPEKSLVAISSRASQMTAEQSAWEHMQRFTPLSLLYFDPYVLITSRGNSIDSLGTIGFDDELDDTTFIGRVASSKGMGAQAQMVGMEAKTLLAALKNRNIDTAIIARSDLVEAEIGGEVTLLHTYDGSGTAGGNQDDPPVYGRWAALFLSKSASQEQLDMLASSLGRATTDSELQAQLEHVEEPWNPTDSQEAGRILEKLASQWQAGPHSHATQAPRGRAYAIPVAIAAIAAFPFLMEIFGFMATSVAVTSLIMALLWAEFGVKVLLKIVLINVLIAVTTYLVFYHVFGIPLPTGSLW
ncbi:tripartite tricarboxylate transporter TctB family protein [Halomonas sp. A29]|uniref:tripartite tricarboxylate transporter TctB family protein n=1 Tax=Halomonas sp. A29 TaxID=3102786 RepID=UPI00398B37C2